MAWEQLGVLLPKNTEHSATAPWWTTSDHYSQADIGNHLPIKHPCLLDWCTKETLEVPWNATLRQWPGVVVYPSAVTCC